MVRSGFSLQEEKSLNFVLRHTEREGCSEQSCLQGLEVRINLWEAAEVVHSLGALAAHCLQGLEVRVNLREAAEVIHLLGALEALGQQPASTWWLTVTFSSGSLGFDALFWVL